MLVMPLEYLVKVLRRASMSLTQSRIVIPLPSLAG